VSVEVVVVLGRRDETDRADNRAGAGVGAPRGPASCNTL
jgi:hypothetical protein